MIQHLFSNGDLSVSIEVISRETIPYATRTTAQIVAATGARVTSTWVGSRGEASPVSFSGWVPPEVETLVQSLAQAGERAAWALPTHAVTADEIGCFTVERARVAVEARKLSDMRAEALGWVGPVGSKSRTEHEAAKARRAGGAS